MLYLGTEFAFWVSVDGGQSWAQFNQDLPSVAIFEVAQHESINEIVLATHGRSLWACDVSAFRQLNTKDFASKPTLLKPSDVIRWRRNSRRGGTNRRYSSNNPSSSALIWYSLAEDAEKVELKIQDINGETVSDLTAETAAGLHRASWSLVRTGERGRRLPIANGRYRVSLQVDGSEVASQVLNVVQDPTIAPDAISEEELATVNELLGVDEESEEEDQGNID